MDRVLWILNDFTELACAADAAFATDAVEAEGAAEAAVGNDAAEAADDTDAVDVSGAADWEAASSTQTKSVKVPPASMPRMYCDFNVVRRVNEGCVQYNASHRAGQTV